MRKCVKCGEEKELDLFRKIQIWRSHTCKKCYSEKYASGIPNTGRFKKGQTPWIKGKKNVSKRTEPKYVKKGREPKSTHRLALRSNLWSKSVKERDACICQFCGSKKYITAHHIVPWKDSEELRFDIKNGICLCRKCHSRKERFLEMAKGIFNLPILKELFGNKNQ